MTDEILVMLAVERVERAHPDLVGGLGMYTSRRYRDARTCTSTPAASGRAGRGDETGGREEVRGER